MVAMIFEVLAGWLAVSLMLAIWIAPMMSDGTRDASEETAGRAGNDAAMHEAGPGADRSGRMSGETVRLR